MIDPKTLSYEMQEPPDFPCLAAAKQAKSLSQRMRAIVYGDDRGGRFAWRVLAEGLIYAANRIPEISDTIVDVDNAMRWGFNFDLGPFETWDAIGVEASVAKMDSEGLAVPRNVRRMLAAGHSAFYRTEDGKTWYYDFASEAYRRLPPAENEIRLKNLNASGRTLLDCPSASLVDLADGIFCCEVHTRMNTLNAEVVDFLHRALDYVDQNGEGLVIGNQGKGTPGAFSAGADLLSMAGMALQGKTDVIMAVAERLQTAVKRFRYAPFPVVAAPYGLTLGGGCELCLGADRVVAHAELYMGLVETGVGLLPSGGGCLNLWRKLLGEIPEAVTGVDLFRIFEPVFMNIATAKVSSSAADARAIGFLGPLDRIVFNREHLIFEAKREVQRMLENGYRPPVKRKVKVMGEAALGMVDARVSDMQMGGFISEYDAFLARRVARVISGGALGYGSEVDEDVILALEREAFMAFLKEERTHARVEHMLRTGKPLRN